MGGCISAVSTPQHLIDQVDGDEDDYHKRYLEDQILGEGAFGIVKMVHDVTQKFDSTTANAPLACKTLRKGVVFKNNVVYSPLKPEVLQGEINILRTLRGQKYCLRLQGIYETTKVIYLITEYCGGGMMMEYISRLEEDLTTEDVSRISYQLLSAIDHCCRHNILHRDVKPENIMFQDPLPGSELRLIDFGSGALDDIKKRTQPSSATHKDLIRHTTFAGSAFYQSPEMFQRDYDARTDVWSVGVALYVLVAGYPADCLQKAFNVLQSSKRNLRTDLPHLPSNMPDSFYDLLSMILVYRDKKRVTAGDVLSHEFVKFHKVIQEQQQSNVLSINDISALAAAASELQLEQSVAISARGNVSLKGSVYRHTYFLGFKKFERSLTTLLAAMLSTTELDRLFDILNEHAAAKNTQRQKQQAETAINENTVVGTEATTSKIDDTASNSSKLTTATDNNNKREHEQILSVCKVAELKDIIKNDLKNDAILETISKWPNADSYDNFAYHIELLVVFSSNDTAKSITGSTGRKLSRRGSFRRVNSYSAKASGGTMFMSGSNTSLRSSSSVKSWTRHSSKNGSNHKVGGKRSNSTVQGTNVFANTLRKGHSKSVKANSSTQSR